MKYFIFLDDASNIIYLLQTDTSTMLNDAVEVSKEDFDIVNQHIGIYNFQYIDGVIINKGKNVIKEPPEVSIEQEILYSINMLIELQADLLGGAI